VKVSSAAFLTFPQKALDEGLSSLRSDGFVLAADSWQCPAGCREQYFLNTTGEAALSEFLRELQDWGLTALGARRGEISVTMRRRQA
jgi:hypothetical protein